MSDPNSDSNWKYDLDEVGEDAEIDEFGAELHPGSPSAENTFFVALGVLTTLATFARVVMMAV